MYEVGMSSLRDEEQLIQDGFHDAKGLGAITATSGELMPPTVPRLFTVRSEARVKSKKLTFSHVILSLGLLSLLVYNFLIPGLNSGGYPVLTEAELSARWEAEPAGSIKATNFIVPVERGFARKPTIDKLITASISTAVEEDQREIKSDIKAVEDDGRTYTVVPGDTLSGIARREGVSVDALMRHNAITDPRQIKPGMKLVLSAG